MIHNQLCNIYIASCVPSGGIYQYFLHSDGTLEFVRKTEVDRPMYMASENNKMYVVLRAPFDDTSSGVITYDIDNKGQLVNPSGISSTNGEVACHIAVDEGRVYCANYISGSVIRLPDVVAVHTGCGKNPKRQEKAHAHWVGITPDREYVCAVDLGLDTIYIYDKDLKCISKAKVPDGHGSRHGIFSKNGKYLFCANELESTVSAFRYNNGELSYIDTLSTLPEGFFGENATAAIRIYDNKIYVSNRGHDTISQIKFDYEKLFFERTIDCGGESPRDFNFINDFMICANENTDNVTVYSCKDEFVKVSEVSVEKPLCVV